MEFLDYFFYAGFDSSSALKSSIKTIIRTIKKKWDNANRTKERFFSAQSEWLKGDFCLPLPVCQSTVKKDHQPATTAAGFSGLCSIFGCPVICAGKSGGIFEAMPPDARTYTGFLNGRGTTYRALGTTLRSGPGA